MLLLLAAATLLAAGRPARAALFVTGHDADYHAGRGKNATGARHILQRAVAYVTDGKPEPKLLLVTSLRAPDGEHYDPRFGLRWAGFARFDVATARGAPTEPGPREPVTRPGRHGGTIVEGPVFDVRTVPFDDYDAVIVASDFGGWLRQEELDALNARAAELLALISTPGRGLVVLPQSGRPGEGAADGTRHDRYGFLPFLSGEPVKNRPEDKIRLTPAGLAAGLSPEDVVGNTYHVIFKQAGSLEVLDVDGNERAVTLATRGEGATPSSPGDAGGGGGAEGDGALAPDGGSGSGGAGAGR